MDTFKASRFLRVEHTTKEKLRKGVVGFPFIKGGRQENIVKQGDIVVNGTPSFSGPNLKVNLQNPGTCLINWSNMKSKE